MAPSIHDDDYYTFFSLFFNAHTSTHISFMQQQPGHLIFNPHFIHAAATNTGDTATVAMKTGNNANIYHNLYHIETERLIFRCSSDIILIHD